MRLEQQGTSDGTHYDYITMFIMFTHRYCFCYTHSTFWSCWRI